MDNNMDNNDEPYSTYISRNQKKRITKNSKLKKKVPKYLTGERRIIGKYDIQPTEEKILKYGEEIKKTKLGCTCCDVDVISKIIGRQLYPCFRCYCCAGDNPTFDQPNICIEIGGGMPANISWN